jgi:hypothetical protein
MRANLKRPAWVVALGVALVGLVLPADHAYAQKEQFKRSKPHVNVGKNKPKSLYFPETMLERKQGARLKASSTPRDAASGLPTGKRQHKPMSLTR